MQQKRGRPQPALHFPLFFQGGGVHRGVQVAQIFGVRAAGKHIEKILLHHRGKSVQHFLVLQAEHAAVLPTALPSAGQNGLEAGRPVQRAGGRKHNGVGRGVEVHVVFQRAALGFFSCAGGQVNAGALFSKEGRFHADGCGNALRGAHHAEGDGLGCFPQDGQDKLPGGFGVLRCYAGPHVAAGDGVQLGDGAQSRVTHPVGRGIVHHHAAKLRIAQLVQGKGQGQVKVVVRISVGMKNIGEMHVVRAHKSFLRLRLLLRPVYHTPGRRAKHFFVTFFIK